MEEVIKKEEDPVEDHLESSSSPETLNKIAQNRRQSSYSAEPSNHQSSNKDTESGEPWEGKVDPWKPLNCLVEAANRTKSFKFNSQGSAVKSKPTHDPDSEVNVPKTKTRERGRKPKVQDDKNDNTTLGLVKPRKLHPTGRKRASASWEPGKLAQAILDAAGAKHNRGISPIWFTLVASEEQEGDAPLPQISACYLRIK
ncbi:hypothetical protein BVC80_1749g1 [Macleaya cordata]|uniref:Uncharacterized protein n=1 Tax=Macleaya cordata TaxID=56857 RepID=A0A200QL75_MACCD|nr:hypothetical protein BVC80_1749g1 [Macleaya cordata]